MSYQDFVDNFQRLEICYLGPDTLMLDDGDDEAHKWEGTLFEGGWKSRVNAGGCRNYSCTSILTHCSINSMPITSTCVFVYWKKTMSSALP